MLRVKLHKNDLEKVF